MIKINSIKRHQKTTKKILWKKLVKICGEQINFRKHQSFADRNQNQEEDNL